MTTATTTFQIVDESTINQITTPAAALDYPIYMCAFSADKGPEEFQQDVGSDTFFKLYGDTPSFANHGQPLLQSAAIVNAGGRLFCKRIVADDSKLANIGIVANVTKTSVQKTDSTGAPLYLDSSQHETIVATGNTPEMVQKATIAFTAKSISIEGNSISAMASAFYSGNKHTNEKGTDGSYALFFIADNGRGVSNKTFRIYADTSSARPVDYVKYILTVSENGTVLETMTFSLNPDIIYSGENISIEMSVKNNSKQIRCKMFEDEIEAFTSNVAYLAGITYSDYKNSDVFFGNNLDASPYNNVIIDTTNGISMDTAAGISLVGGDNGAFGTSPITATTYEAQLTKVFNGSDGDDIYDLDNNPFYVIFDANYPATTKRAIENLAIFREDVMYFRENGTGLSSTTEISAAIANNTKSMFCADYTNSWDILDPYTKKQITVTSNYNLAPMFVKHYLNGVSRPFAGINYGITFSDPIDGTINFTPKNTPSENQKQFFDDNRLNYCTYYNGTLTMDTEYTSQKAYTQLSWINNILMIQQLIREIRTLCPKTRYTFMTGDGFKTYKEDVNSLLSNHSTEYKNIYMDYVEDSTYVSNKIFYAVIYVQFKNFVQSEIFKIVAIQS